MRISDFLRASFVGALLFTPAMASEVEQVHEEALRLLREKLGQSNSPGSNGSAAPSQTVADNPVENAAREGRAKAEAQQQWADRERLQAERRQEFEQFVKERERLRQEQPAYDLQVAQQTGQVHGSSYNDVHARALEVLRQAQAQTPSQPARPVPAVTEAELAPRVVAQSSALSSSTPAGSSDVHTKALDVLRQQSQPASVGGSSTEPKPSPELQQRLKQMQAELEQEQLERSRSASTPVSESYVSDLER